MKRFLHTLLAGLVLLACFLVAPAVATADEVGTLTATTGTTTMLTSQAVATTTVYGTSVTLGTFGGGTRIKAVHIYPTLTLGSATNCIIMAIASPDPKAATTAYQKLRDYSLTMTASETGHIRVPTSATGGHVLTIQAVSSGTMTTTPTLVVKYKTEQ
jgi:hypothetical protein